MKQQPENHAPQQAPSPMSITSYRRLAIEFLLAGLVLIGVFWKDIAALIRRPSPAAPVANVSQDRASSPQEPARWDYWQALTNEVQLGSDLKNYGARGWELVAVVPTTRDFAIGSKDIEYKLILRRPHNAATENEKTGSIVGIWQLTGGSREDLIQLNLECTQSGKVKVWGKGTKEFAFDGTYEMSGDNLCITLMVDKHREISQEKIKKLTDHELIIEDEEGKVEEYQRK